MQLLVYTNKSYSAHA